MLNINARHCDKTFYSITHHCVFVNFSCRRRAMGTKMSFGRGSGDQNTDSHLTSASPPCSFVHTPSDCKQIPDDERGSEDRNATDMNQTALRASEHVESDVHLSSKTTDRSCRPSEDTLSQ
ncbi:hypothetical protein ATANTOWER_010878, partial [Ataeniobius toweri]|nr:hypothetical protein [Ataeniobius toweri]